MTASRGNCRDWLNYSICAVLCLCMLVLGIWAAAPAAGAGSAVSAADDQHWPQWRGPVGTGVAPAGNPPVEWGETKNVKWKVKIPGEGTATPIVWGDRVFIQAAVPTGKRVEAAAAQPGSRPADANRPLADSERPQAGSSSLVARMLDRFDANKDGKFSRAEVSEGTLRGIFDRMIEQHKLDAEKTYTREELEKVLGVTASAGNSPGGNAPGSNPPGGNPPEGPQQDRRGGGGGRGTRPTEAFQFVLMCLDRQTGKVLWQQVAREEVPHEGHHNDGSFASSSPVTDGEHVFAYFGSRGLYCFDMTGKLEWSQDFGDQRITNTFGEGSSPTLAGDAIIVKWDHEGESFIIALDKKTGRTLWRKPRDERTSWSTPLVVEHSDKRQVVTTASNRVRSYDLASGELIWECGGMTRNVIPTPVAGPGMLYAISGHQGSSLLAIRLGRTGNLTGTDAIAWEHHKSTPYVPSPLLYGDRLYFFASNNAILTCFDVQSGRPVIGAQRLGELQGVYASPVGAAGRVYLVGRNGATLVIKDASKLEVLATNRLDDRLDASPAVAGNELFLRGRTQLYCIAEQ